MIFLLGMTEEECENNVVTTVNVLQKLGFDISDKSALQPSQKLTHLGFILDSKTMTVSLGLDKREQIIKFANQILSCSFITVRKLAKLGTFIAALPGVEYGLLYYRELEFCKIIALRERYDFDRLVSISEKAREEIFWWIEIGVKSNRKISHGNPDFVLRCDSSDFAWGSETLHNNANTQYYSVLSEILTTLLYITMLIPRVSGMHQRLSCTLM